MYLSDGYPQATAGLRLPALAVRSVPERRLPAGHSTQACSVASSGWAVLDRLTRLAEQSLRRCWTLQRLGGAGSADAGSVTSKTGDDETCSG